MPDLKPTVSPGQFYVVFAERDTGIVCTPDGDRWFPSEGDARRDVYMVCNTLRDAKEHAAVMMRSYPKFEAVIYDSNHRGIRYLGE